MDDPEKILSKIMNFERTYTPQFTDLIKQSLIDEIDIDGDIDSHDTYKHKDTYQSKFSSTYSISDRHSFQSPLSSYNKPYSKPSIESQAISLSQPPPNTMPSYDNKHKKHKHKTTPFMSRDKPNSVKIIDTNSFIITDDLQYNSDSNSEEEEDDDDNNNNPLIEEYDGVSHEIHKLKLKLRKLDRQMTIAERQNQSQSNFVKQHSDIKIKIAQLISKRRQLETNDVIREYIKEEDTDTVEINVNETTTDDINDILDASGLMEINEDEEEEDEIKHNTISPINHSSSTDDNSDDNECDDGTLQGYLNSLGSSYTNSTNGNDDRSRTTSTNMNDFDFSYDAVNEEYEQEPLSGSVKFHSDEENDSDNNSADADDGGGSVQYHSGSESDESGGSMKIHGSDSNHGEEYESDSDSGGGGGSVQLNDDIENNENWVDDEFDNKEINLDGNDDDDENDENTNENTDNNIVSISEKKESVRSKRLEQMRSHKNYKEYTDPEAKPTGDLDELKHKYRNRRRHREQISEIETPFDFNELMKGIDDVDINNENNSSSDSKSNDSDNDVNDIKGDSIDNDVNDITNVLMQYKVLADDDDETYPTIPVSTNINQPLLLDINQFSAKLTNIVEEEECFQTVEYQTDSDCDSQDSVVIKKEITKNVEQIDGNE